MVLQGWRCRDGAAGTVLQGWRCRDGAAGMVLQGRCCRDGAAGMGLQGRCCRDGAAGMGLQGRCCRDGAAGMGLQGWCCRDGAAGMALQGLRHTVLTVDSGTHPKQTIRACGLSLNPADSADPPGTTRPWTCVARPLDPSGPVVPSTSH